MSKEELLAELESCAANTDYEEAHGEADDALIEYINDPEIKEVFDRVGKWYA